MRKAIVVILALTIAAVGIWSVAFRFSKSGQLIRAITAGDKQAVNRLLEDNPALVNARLSEGQRALHFAVRTHAGVEIAEVLISRGADVNAVDDLGSPPLVSAMAFDNLAAVKLLLVNGAKPNIMAKNGAAALHMAAWKGNTEAAKMLVDAGADVNLPDASRKRYTPLHWAARCGEADVARLLLRSGAKSNIASEEGTPLEVAERHGKAEMVTLLRSHDKSTDVSGANPKG